MAQKDLDFTDVVSGLQQMGGKAVPQRMKSFTVFYTGLFAGFFVDAAHRFVG
jgi:hypothetical protein